MHGETAKQIIRWHFHSVFLRQWFSWKGGKRSCRSLVLLNVSTSPEFIFWSRQRTYIHRFKPEQITKNKRKLLIFFIEMLEGVARYTDHPTQRCAGIFWQFFCIRAKLLSRKLWKSSCEYTLVSFQREWNSSKFFYWVVPARTVFINSNNLLKLSNTLGLREVERVAIVVKPTGSPRLTYSSRPNNFKLSIPTFIY